MLIQNQCLDLTGILKELYCLKAELCKFQRDSSSDSDRTYFSTDFINSDCSDTSLKDKRFRIFYSGVGDKLILGIEWTVILSGGFTIINNSASSRMDGWAPSVGDIFHLEFY